MMYNLLTDLYMIFCSKQFDLSLVNPSGSVVGNKTLYSLRQKMVQEVLENVESYVKNEMGQNRPYRRVKPYNYGYEYTKV